MVADTSALMAILLDKPEADACIAALEGAEELLLSAGTMAEALIVAARRNVGADMADLIDGLNFEIVPVTSDAAQRIALAYEAWGKGQHAAALNFGDGFAYDLAKTRHCPLLYVGRDFGHTDVERVLRGHGDQETPAHARSLRPGWEKAPMRVKRIVANIATSDVGAARRFYQDALGLALVMDLGWVATYGSVETMPAQITIASQGGSGTPVPDLSIEVDDLDSALAALERFGFPAVYGPADEPWGVRRFHVRDPFGRLVNVLEHLER